MKTRNDRNPVHTSLRETISDRQIDNSQLYVSCVVYVCLFLHAVSSFFRQSEASAFLSANQRPAAVCVTLQHSLQIQPASHIFIPLSLHTTHTHHPIRPQRMCYFFVHACCLSIFKLTWHKTVIFLNEQHVTCLRANLVTA